MQRDIGDGEMTHDTACCNDFPFSAPVWDFYFWCIIIFLFFAKNWTDSSVNAAFGFRLLKNSLGVIVDFGKPIQKDSISSTGLVGLCCRLFKLIVATSARFIRIAVGAVRGEAVACCCMICSGLDLGFDWPCEHVQSRACWWQNCSHTVWPLKSRDNVINWFCCTARFEPARKGIALRK